MGKQIPVTPSVISWARSRAGFSLEEAALKFKRIAAWEAPDDDAAPTYAQLEAMAEAFKVPVAVFFFPAPPDVPTVEETFRTMPEAALEAIEPRIKLLLRKAKVLQLNLIELGGGRNPAPRLITRDLRFPLGIAADVMAARVRDYLDVPLEEQIAWPNPETALERWRSRFNAVGVSVFKDQFRSPRFAGFCLTHEEFPLIYVNNTAPKTRQIFTLFHELAHLMFHTSGVDFRRDEDAPAFRADGRRIEVLCNRFAGVLLVPDDAFLAAMAGQPANAETARALAQRFNVSSLVIFRKMLDHNMIDAARYRSAHDAAAEERETGSGGSFYNNHMAYLGRSYVGLVLAAYHQHRISEAAVADYLLTNPRNVPGLEERFLKSAAA